MTAPSDKHLTVCTCDECHEEFWVETEALYDDERCKTLACIYCGSDEFGWSEYFGDD